MKQFLGVLLLAAAASALNLFGDKPAGFKIRFDVGFGSGSKFFFDIGHELSHVTKDGWTQVERPEGDILPTLRMFCPSPDYTFCTYYDDSDYIAGLQIALPVDGFTESIPSDLTEIGFKQWTVNGTTYWTHKQFFTSQKLLEESHLVREQMREAEPTLYNGGIWVTDYNHELFHIDADGSKMEETGFTKQGCIPAMGQHYYYNMTKEADVNHLFPWFTLVSDGRLVGTGFMVFGKLPKLGKGQRDWFEHPAKLAVQVIVPVAPEELYEMASDPTVVTMHIYYVKNPALLECINEAVTGVVNGVTGAVTGVVGGVTGAVSGIASGITGLFG